MLVGQANPLGNGLVHDETGPVVEIHDRTTTVGSIGEIRARNFTVYAVNGERLPLNPLLGKHRPVVLVFWSSWCASSRQAVLALNEVERLYRRQGMILVGLTTESHLYAGNEVARAIREWPLRFPVVCCDRDVYFHFNPDREVVSVPRVFIFDGAGKPVRQFNGYNPFLDQKAFAEAARQAMEASAIAAY